MKTLVYFASGPIKKEYHDLDFDKIYLIDNCFKNRRPRNNLVFTEDKITCIGMDCLQSISVLKEMDVKIDCFVSINEGLAEGGGDYAINSDMFLGYAMPLFKDNYIHILSEKYYQSLRRGLGRGYHVTMDLPYSKEEIKEDDPRYINPAVFSYEGKDAKVFQMSKIENNTIEIDTIPRIKTRIIHDSIWNYYEQLDALAISILDQGQGKFFGRIPKVLNINRMEMDEIFVYCQKYQIEKLGFTPWSQGCYEGFVNKLKHFKGDYPKEISLFHLNFNDFHKLKEYAGRV